MPNSHRQCTLYTPELIRELNSLAAHLPRAEGVKAVGKRLKIADRQARSIYSRYVDAKGVPLTARQAVEMTVAKELKPRKIKRLFLDLETSPNIGLFWRSGYKLNIGPENIIQERAIICAGYMWEGETKASVLVWDGKQCDKGLLSKLIEIIAEADEVVLHNGDRFDMPWVRTRTLFHRLRPFPEVTQVDTLKWARSKFLFNSNKLDYIARLLGIGAKIKTEYGLWKDVVLKKCPKALKQMSVYCAGDVLLLEKVWARLAEWMPAKVHVGVLNGNEKWSCPRTGSTNVRMNNVRVTATGTKRYRFQNKDDGTWYTVGQVAYGRYLEECRRST